MCETYARFTDANKLNPLFGFRTKANVENLAKYAKLLRIHPG